MNTKKIVRSITSKVLPAVAGGVGAKFVKSIGKKVTTNETVRAALPLILGLLLVQSAKTESIGLGLCAVGGADLAATMIPSIAGIEDMDLSGLFGEPTLNDDIEGYDVGGYDVGAAAESTLNGFEDGVADNYGNY